VPPMASPGVELHSYRLSSSVCVLNCSLLLTMKSLYPEGVSAPEVV
jgi:hypothetical protein